jgi:hypothetical protein
MPPCGGPTGEKSDSIGGRSGRERFGRINNGAPNDGVSGTPPNLLCVPLSGVVINRPRLLIFFLAGMIGTMKDGEAGAEKACELLVEPFVDTKVSVEFVPTDPILGSDGVESVLMLLVFTDKFFMFRGFFIGELRPNPEWLDTGPLDIGLGALSPTAVAMFRIRIEDNELGLSGDELGDDSLVKLEELIVEVGLVPEDVVAPECRLYANEGSGFGVLS